jgi:hypothetical protein
VLDAVLWPIDVFMRLSFWVACHYWLPPSPATSADSHIQSSASSQGGGAYNAVLSNPDYAQRRQSWDDMKAPGGFGGIFGNLMGRSAEKK